MKKKKAKASKSLLPKPAPRIHVWPWHAVAIALVILLFAGIRIRLRDFPLERDEGEYAYAGQLILQGVPPYQLAYNMKLPGTYAAYSLILAIFGQSPAGIHAGLLLVNASTILLVYFLAMRLFDETAGVVAGAAYALLSTSPSVLGQAAHASHFVVLPGVAGLLLLLRAVEPPKKLWPCLLSGLLFGLAFLMKQPGIFFVLFGGLYLLRKDWTTTPVWRSLLLRIGAFTIGAVLPYALTCMILYRARAFQKFWFWTVLYASQYGTRVSLREGLENLWSQFPMVMGSSALIWIMAAVGLAAFWWDRKARPHAEFAVGLLIFSFLAVCVGLYFRDHYFIFVLPAISLLAGLAVSSGIRQLSESRDLQALRSLPALIFIAGCAYSLYDQRAILFEMDMLAACRAVYGANPFPEAIEIGNYIRDHSAPSSRLAVLGSEPEIYFYSGRRSATGYIYTYSLMEDQKYAASMQKEMIGEIEAARPDFLVFVRTPFSWLVRPQSEKMILSWADRYIQDHYALVGIGDSLDPTGYRWEAAAAAYSPRSPYVVLVFKRNT